MSDLRKLSTPFPARYIEQHPKGDADYVAHHIITQRLLEVVGPYSFTVDRVLSTDPVALVATLTVIVDGREVSVTEVGEHDSPHAPAFKSAASDALKRCAMRLGLGLHLWSQEHYFLHRALTKRATIEENES